MKSAKINTTHVYDIMRGKSRRYSMNMFKIKENTSCISCDFVKNEEFLVRRSACDVVLVPIQMDIFFF